MTSEVGFLDGKLSAQTRISHRIIFSDKDFVTAVVASNEVLATDVVSRNLQSDQQTFVDTCSYVTVDAVTVSAVCAESIADPTNTEGVNENFISVSFLTLNAPVS